jgi:hypothetical protein
VTIRYKQSNGSYQESAGNYSADRCFKVLVAFILLNPESLRSFDAIREDWERLSERERDTLVNGLLYGEDSQRDGDDSRRESKRDEEGRL